MENAVASSTRFAPARPRPADQRILLGRRADSARDIGLAPIGCRELEVADPPGRAGWGSREIRGKHAGAGVSRATPRRPRVGGGLGVRCRTAASGATETGERRGPSLEGTAGDQVRSGRPGRSRSQKVIARAARPLTSVNGPLFSPILASLEETSVEERPTPLPSRRGPQVSWQVQSMSRVRSHSTVSSTLPESWSSSIEPDTEQ